MHKIVIPLFIIIFLSAPISLSSQEESCLKVGDYISKVFINKIKNGFSLEKASYDSSFIFATAYQKENTFQIGMSNFHDSVYLDILSDCHTIKDVEKYSVNYIFEKIDKNSFKIKTGKENIIFNYVGDNSYSWLAIQIFSGEWSDKKGNDLSFQKDGNVKINGSLSPYTIGEQVIGEEIGNVYDIVKIGNSNYFFKITNNTLFLYEATEWDISKEPKYVLNSKNH